MTTSSAESQHRPSQSVAAGASQRALARSVARALADHPILPAPSALSLREGSLQRLLGDLTRGGKSEHADILREVSEEQGVPLEEIARRAQFTLACLLLPASGTAYEALGVAPDASAAEIREHWTAAIHRYHPDRFGGQNPWLDTQARRLIEAYETLRNPERRRQYDADLARSGPRLHPPIVCGGDPSPRSRRRLLGWRLGLSLLAVVIGGLWIWMRLELGLTSTPPPVPPSPRLLETWRSQFLAPAPAEPAPGGPLRRDVPQNGEVAQPRPATNARSLEPDPSLRRAAPLGSARVDSNRGRRAAELDGESAADSPRDASSMVVPMASPSPVTPEHTRTDR